MIKKIRNIITVMLLMGAGTLSAQAQTYFEPAAKDVVTPTGLQKNVSRSTDIVMLALPVATLAGVLIERDWDGLVQGIETAGATAAATLILKYAVCERRPDGSDMHSFPSAHSAVSFATAAFLQRRYGWAFGAPAYALAAYVGWGRVYSGKHHWWDVVAGGAIGAASAYIFTKPFAKKHNLQVSPISDGRSVGVYASMEF
ncbi:phosphatase PAP2 family protein [Sangeribacter muris]|uniref:phosphatase PAP2 family protein n=1 Tax=Sangeribacter muris TaxID=2880703 RepID=UPI00244DB6BD|nr:phosphatase PAP2 family protein [Sangeribacter muris]